MGSYRLPQFFQKGADEILQNELLAMERKEDLINNYHQNTRVEDPNELLADMSDFIQEVGYTSSFMDQT